MSAPPSPASARTRPLPPIAEGTAAASATASALAARLRASVGRAEHAADAVVARVDDQQAGLLDRAADRSSWAEDPKYLCFEAGCASSARAPTQTRREFSRCTGVPSD